MTLARSIGTMQAIVLADGDVGVRSDLDAAWPGWLEPGAVVVAADGGARHAPGLGLSIDRWVGDGDSLGADGIAALRSAGVPVELVDAAKDESDTGLAIRTALGLGADRIVILGGLGGPRVDHALANIGLLALPSLRGVPACLLDPAARISLIRAPDGAGEPVRRTLPGPVGGTVSLLPQGSGVTGVTTSGLRYPLADEPLPPGPARGLSNVRTSEAASVVVRSGDLLVVEGPATLST
jgi:thiamine pyrophosphokinase